MKLTADTITDAQIRELRDSLVEHHEANYLARADCAHALMNWRPEKAEKIRAARSRCAKRINARTKETT